MKVTQFVKNNRDDWVKLEQLISTMQKRKSQLSAKDIEIFYKSYQKVTQHLSYSQTYFKTEDVTSYLNSLVAKAHNLLYKDQMTSMKQLRYFFSSRFVRLLTEQWKFVIAAMILFMLGGLGSFLAVLNDPLHLYAIVPAEIAQSVDPEQLGAGHDMIDSSFMSASIMTNNIQVAILAFAGGITFGLLTVYVLILNGVIIGALAALFWHAGMTYEFWAYIIPHGMIELTAIFIAGGAGLLMGYKLIVPGYFKRSYQLKTQAMRSVQLLLGTIPLFIIAGIIEGYITPSSLSLEMKYFIALITVFGMLFYILIGNLLIQKRKHKELSSNKTLTG